MAEYPNDLTLFFDGGCEPKNPGGYGVYGWLLQTIQGELLATGKGVCSEPKDGKRSTNNVSEYCALGFGLRHLADLGWKGELTIYGDSKLVVCQVAGKWKTKKEHLRPLRDRCRELLKQLGDNHELLWIPRESNEECDQLCRQAFSERTGYVYPERRKKRKAEMTGLNDDWE